MDEIEKMSYEQARDELIALTHRLEAGVSSLDESLSLWERGTALARHCESILSGAQERLAAMNEAEPSAPGESTDTSESDQADAQQ